MGAGAYLTKVIFRKCISPDLPEAPKIEATKIEHTVEIKSEMEVEKDYSKTKRLLNDYARRFTHDLEAYSYHDYDKGRVPNAITYDDAKVIGKHYIAYVKLIDYDKYAEDYIDTHFIMRDFVARKHVYGRLFSEIRNGFHTDILNEEFLKKGIENQLRTDDSEGAKNILEALDGKNDYDYAKKRLKTEFILKKIKDLPEIEGENVELNIKDYKKLVSLFSEEKINKYITPQGRKLYEQAMANVKKAEEQEEKNIQKTFDNKMETQVIPELDNQVKSSVDKIQEKVEIEIKETEDKVMDDARSKVKVSERKVAYTEESLGKDLT